MLKSGTPEYWLRRNFVEVLDLPDDAIEWLIDLWQVVQLFDDIVDGDKIDRDDADAAISLNGKSTYLGVFSDALNAHNAYLKAKREMHEGCVI